MRNTEEPKWLPSFCLSLSLSSTTYTCLSISLPLCLPSSLSLSEEVTVQGGGYDHRAEHMLQLHPLAAARRLTTNTIKNPTETQTLDQFRSSVWSLQHRWHHHVILNPGQIHGVNSIRWFTHSHVCVSNCNSVKFNSWKITENMFKFKFCSRNFPSAATVKCWAPPSNEANMKKMEVKLQLWSYSTHHIGTGLTWH